MRIGGDAHLEVLASLKVDENNWDQGLNYALVRRFTNFCTSDQGSDPWGLGLKPSHIVVEK